MIGCRDRSVAALQKMLSMAAGLSCLEQKIAVFSRVDIAAIKLWYCARAHGGRALVGALKLQWNASRVKHAPVCEAPPLSGRAVASFLFASLSANI